MGITDSDPDSEPDSYSASSNSSQHQENNFPQDSSEVVRDDYSSFDPFDE